MFYVYWCLVLVALFVPPIVVVLCFPTSRLTAWYGWTLGELVSNNNYRCAAFWLLAIVLTGSALCAGFGQPIFGPRAMEMARPTVEAAKAKAQNESFKSAWENILGNGRVKLITKPQPASVEKTELAKPVYHSWWHWGVMIIAWLWAIIYTPIAFRDEAVAAFRKAWEAGKNTGTTSGGSTTEGSGAATATATTATSSTKGWTFWWDLLTDFLGEFSGNIASAMLPRFMRG